MLPLIAAFGNVTMQGGEPVYERDGARVLKRVDLAPHHSSRRQTRHYLPRDQANPYPIFVSLEIAKYDDAPGYYLFHITDEGENSDTCHSSMEEAMAQANFEFGITAEEWLDVEKER